MTVTGDTLSELTGALTEAASLLQTADAQAQLVAELAPLANGAEQPPLPTPAPDYEAAGLTEFQQLQMRQAQSQPIQAAAAQPAAVQVAPQSMQATSAPVQAVASTTPFCGVHQQPMVWKGGGLSKNGKELPLWSCPDRNCRQAIWAQH